MKLHLKAKKYDVIRYHIQCDRLSFCLQYLKIGKIILKDKLLDKCLWRVCYYYQVYHSYYNELLLWNAFIRFHLQILFLHKEDFHRHYYHYCFLGFHCLPKCHHLHLVCLNKAYDQLFELQLAIKPVNQCFNKFILKFLQFINCLILDELLLDLNYLLVIKLSYFKHFLPK